jgi:competence protein ComEA
MDIAASHMRKEEGMKRRLLTIACFITVLAFFMVPVALLAGEKINLNTATLEELMTLERIGPKYAQRIIDYRKDHGPFESIEDIVKVKGIGRKTLEANRDQLTVE